VSRARVKAGDAKPRKLKKKLPKKLRKKLSK